MRLACTRKCGCGRKYRLIGSGRCFYKRKPITLTMYREKGDFGHDGNNSVTAQISNVDPAILVPDVILNVGETPSKTARK
jgi:hypothetical protein